MVTAPDKLTPKQNEILHELQMSAQLGYWNFPARCGWLTKDEVDWLIGIGYRVNNWSADDPTLYCVISWVKRAHHPNPPETAPTPLPRPRPSLMPKSD